MKKTSFKKGGKTLWRKSARLASDNLEVQEVVPSNRSRIGAIGSRGGCLHLKVDEPTIQVQSSGGLSCAMGSNVWDGESGAWSVFPQPCLFCHMRLGRH